MGDLCRGGIEEVISCDAHRATREKGNHPFVVKRTASRRRMCEERVARSEIQDAGTFEAGGNQLAMSQGANDWRFSIAVARKNCSGGVRLNFDL